MKPLNQKERNNLFFQFLLFYVISIIVVLFAAFGNIQMIQKQSQVAKDDKDKLQKKLANSELFFQQMGIIEDIFSQVNSTQARANNESKFKVENSNLLNLYQNQNLSDSAWVNRQGWFKIISGYDRRWLEKSDVVDDKESQTIISKRDETIRDLEKQVRDYDKALRDCQNKQ